ncbi:hypothetical protein TrST_g5716 [Triparma strigata]|uniref:Kinesin motor domain-containing protein n=1 Tax=Triparma strigata TaxID=1606541 RepID=A0A9W7EDT4_9STRA|nr:hypothetical protein TrST_g5716 [Triparma strigata]
MSSSTPDHSYASLSCGVLTVGEDRKTVYFPESNLSSIVSFQYDHVFPVQGREDWIKGFKVATTSVLSGKNATVCLTGSENGTRSVLEGNAKSDYDGVLSKICGEIVEHLGDYGPGDPKTYKNRVTINWYSLHVTKGEGIVDMLKSSVAAGSLDISPDLIMKDCGSGRGVAIPELWEIEIRSSNDIKDILRRVRANSASINPLLHNVFTVTLEKLPINTSHIGAGKTYHAEGAEEVDTTPVKLTIVTLASLKNQSKLGNKWLVNFEETLDRLSNGVVEKYGYVPSLNTSRLDMLLSDMLLGRDQGTVMAVVDPGLNECEVSLKVLKLVEKVKVSAREVTGEEEGEEEKTTTKPKPQQQLQFTSPTQYSQNESSIYYPAGGLDSDDSNSSNGLSMPVSPQAAAVPQSVENSTVKNQDAAESFAEQLAEARAVPQSIFNALELRQRENIELENKITNFQRTVAELQFERDDLKMKLAGEGGALKTKDRAALRKALGEVKDYEVYKEVMEQTFHRMKNDIAELTKDRDRYATKLERCETALRKERSEVVKLKKTIGKMEVAVDQHKSEALSYSDQYGKAREENLETQRKFKIAARELLKLREKNSQQEAELEAAKRRISRIIVDKHGEGGIVGANKAGGRSPVKDKSPSAKALVQHANRKVMSPQKWKEKEGAMSNRAKKNNTMDSLSRAEGSLNAARRIMFAD